jgi:hypothetical protein
VRAAKFREETPRKGGGLAIKDRDTALQQYDGTQFRLQELRREFPDKTPQKGWINSCALPRLNAVAKFCDNCAMQQVAFCLQQTRRGKYDGTSRYFLDADGVIPGITASASK